MKLTHLQIDKIKGVIFGQAIGDALGLATEFMSKDEVKKAYPDGINHYTDIQQDEHTERWETGDWTDDTDQMLCILDAILEDKKVIVGSVCRNFKSWFDDEPMGIGNTVYSVLSNPRFREDPFGVSEKVWQDSGKDSAANGGVMRTAILGVWDFREKKQVIENAKNICRITHFDPRCVASCVAVSLAISELLTGTQEISNLFSFCIKEAMAFDIGIRDEIGELPDKIEQLELDKEPGIGYTYKATKAGFWALKYGDTFFEGIQSIIHQGGDADTNAAVGGALLGAKFGFQKIPAALTDGLVFKDQLDAKIEALLHLM